MPRRADRKRARWIPAAACALLALSPALAGAQSGTTSLTLHLEAGVIVEPPRLLTGAERAGPAGPLVEAGCDGLEERGELATGPWRIMTLGDDGWVEPHIAVTRAGAAAGSPESPPQEHCGTVEPWSGGELRCGRTLLHHVSGHDEPGLEGPGLVTFVVERL